MTLIENFRTFYNWTFKLSENRKDQREVVFWNCRQIIFRNWPIVSFLTHSIANGLNFLPLTDRLKCGRDIYSYIYELIPKKTGSFSIEWTNRLCFDLALKTKRKNIKQKNFRKKKYLIADLSAWVFLHREKN